MKPTLLPILLAALAPLIHLGAATITLTDPNADYSATSTADPQGWPVQTTGYLSYGSDVNEFTYFTNLNDFNSVNGAPLGEENFATAFSNWANGNGWSLQNGGSLDNLTMSISTFDTFATPTVGGVEIQVDFSVGIGYTGPALNSLFWIQGLMINYRPGDNGNANYNTMDSFTFNQLGGTPTAITGNPFTVAGDVTVDDPLYPYQYADRHFYDKPQGIWPIDSFRGEALLATADGTNKVITVYNGGVNYGFDLIPEPSAAILVVIFSGYAVARRRRATH